MPEGSEEFDYLSTVKVLLGINGDEYDGVLPVYISMVRQSILNYCNRSDLPEALNYTLCQMTADTYKDTVSRQSTGDVKGNVASISEDGRSVSFTNGTEFRAAVEDRITRTSELNRFKKLYRIERHEPEGMQTGTEGVQPSEEGQGGDGDGPDTGA